MRGRQTRGLPDRAVDIDDETAGSTHEMMVVVSDAPLVEGNRPGRLNAPHKPDLGESVERVVHGLMGDLGEALPDRSENGLRVRMRMIAHRLEDRDPLLRHAKRALPQCCGRFVVVFMILLSHTLSMPRSFERVKEGERLSWTAQPLVLT